MYQPLSSLLRHVKWKRTGTKRNGNFGLQVFVPNFFCTPYASTLNIITVKKEVELENYFIFSLSIEV